MYVTLKERYQIELLLSQGYSPYRISQILNRPNPTIYREIKRGMVEFLDSELKPYKKYCADVAQRKYEENRTNKGRTWKIGNDLEFAKFVEYMIIEKRYSPDAVLMYIKKHNLQFKTQICRNTLYNYIYKGVFLNVRKEHYIYKRRKQAKHIKVTKSGGCYRKGKSIEERPKNIAKRLSYGHWEMDTVQGAKGTQKCLLVLTERKTREEKIFLLNDKKAKSVVDALDNLEKKIGLANFSKIFKTITCDNGVEFSDWQGITRSVTVSNKARTKLYFCHPYSAWERGSNENNNKLVRRWFPKGCDFSCVTPAEIEALQDWVNDYPRKQFFGLSSIEKSSCARTIL